MTKKQVEESAPGQTRLGPGAVVRAGLELLDEKGADGLSIRGIADRLGVRMNTVLWHAKTKARLLELMADAILAEVPVEGLPEPWEPRVRELFHRYRRALLAHRDGARIVAGTYAAEPATLRFAELLVEALLAAWAPGARGGLDVLDPGLLHPRAGPGGAGSAGREGPGARPCGWVRGSTRHCPGPPSTSRTPPSTNASTTASPASWAREAGRHAKGRALHP